jgi:hypothetical protein
MVSQASNTASHTAVHLQASPTLAHNRAITPALVPARLPTARRNSIKILLTVANSIHLRLHRTVNSSRVATGNSHTATRVSTNSTRRLHQASLALQTTLLPLVHTASKLSNTTRRLHLDSHHMTLMPVTQAIQALRARLMASKEVGTQVSHNTVTSISSSSQGAMGNNSTLEDSTAAATTVGHHHLRLLGVEYDG